MLPALALFVSGTASAFFTTGFAITLVFSAVAAAAVIVAKKPLLLFFLAAGILSGWLSRPAIAEPNLRDGVFTVETFRVTGFPVLRDDGQYEIKCGRVKLVSPTAFSLYRSQDVRAAGSVSVSETNGFRSFRIYAKEVSVVGEGFKPFRFVSLVRKWVNDRIGSVKNIDVRTLLYAMITGNTNFLGYSVKESFRMTGITHLLAISGLNVAVIGIGIFFILKKIAGQKPALLVSIAAVALYVITAGFGASILRAGIMFTLYQGLKLTGRNPDPIDVVIVSVFPVLAFDAALLSDIGFWLSYGALLGILFLSSGIRDLFRVSGRAVNAVSETVAVTLSANLTTLPVLVFFFRGISLAAPIANLLVIPVFNILTFALFAEFLAVIAGIPFIPFLLETLLGFLWTICVTISDWLSFIPYSYISFTERQALYLTVFYCLFAVSVMILPPALFRIRLKKLALLRRAPSAPEETPLKE